MRKLLSTIMLLAMTIPFIYGGCSFSGGGGSGPSDGPKPKPVPFEVTGHQLYLVDHQCLVDCGYGGEMECIIANCLAEIDGDLLCRGDIILLEVYGRNVNENTIELWYAVDYTDGTWDGSIGGAVDAPGKNFKVFATEGYYLTDPDTYGIETWFVDADRNKTHPYDIAIDFGGCD